MHMKNLIGLTVGAIAILLGAYFFVAGGKIQASSMKRIKEKVTGNVSHAKRNYMIGGIVFVVVGAGLLFYFRPKKRH